MLSLHHAGSLAAGGVVSHGLVAPFWVHQLVQAPLAAGADKQEKGAHSKHSRQGEGADLQSDQAEVNITSSLQTQVQMKTCRDKAGGDLENLSNAIWVEFLLASAYCLSRIRLIGNFVCKYRSDICKTITGQLSVCPCLRFMEVQICCREPSCI